ncbi:thiol reductant ABC exporter subunit CydD [Oenococcus alcoholitolerans]|uniref:thiol reductant ABC exporter subunit CydD n=1 Tax=Oenococcus alcoholitolerans TaxID=931074 RepID=UPI003F6FEFC0
MLDKNILKIKSFKNYFISLITFSVFDALLVIGQTLFLTRTLTEAWSLKNGSKWIYSIVFFGLFFCVRQFVLTIKKKRANIFAQKSSSNLKEELLKTIFKNGTLLVDHQGSGSIVNLIFTGIDKIKFYLNELPIKIADLSVTPWIILICVFYLNWPSGLILLLVFPLTIFFLAILGIAAKNKSEEQYHGFQILNNHFLDSIRGLKTLKMLGISHEYGKSIVKVSDDYRKRTMKVLTIAFTSSFALDFFTTLSIAIEAVFLGIALIDGRVSLYPALAVLIISPEYFLPLRQFGEGYHANLDGKNALTKLFDILENSNNVTSASSKLDQKLDLWSDKSALVVDKLNFSYPDASEKTFSDLSFSANGYQKIGLVGPSGSGKSTLIKILAGFLPLSKEGEKIFINGKNAELYNSDDWRDQIAYIPQDPYIFSATIADNIAFYSPDIDRSVIERSAAEAGLNDFISSLPDGLDTNIGDQGREISGGQAQRIALARIFAEPRRKIIFLDEPTAHLDLETEYQLKGTLQKVMEDHLVFFSTHRLHWLKQMDKILVLDNKSIAEAGSYSDLISKKGKLYQMVKELQPKGDLKFVQGKK